MDLPEARRVAALVAEWTPRLETRDAREACGRLDEARDAIVGAADWAVEDAPGVATDLVVAGATYWVGRGLTGSASPWTRRLLQVFEDPSERRARLLATLVRLGGVRGDFETRALAEEALRLGVRLSLRDVAIEALYELAMLAGPGDTPTGDPVAGLAAVRDLRPRTVRERAIQLELEACVARLEGGPPAEAAVLARGLEDARRDGMLRRMVHIGGNLCELQLWRGRTSEAGALAAEAALDAREIGDGRNEARALSVLAIVHALGGDRRRAGRALLRGVVLAAAIDVPAPAGDVALSAALLAALDEMPGRVPWLLGAATMTGWSTAAADADPALGQALARARSRLGAAAWARAWSDGRQAPAAVALECAESVAAAYKDVRGRRGRATLQLSLREIEVLSLLGGGLSDAEIGARLSISAKTVSVHLVNAKAKTGAKGRVELALLGRELLDEP